MWKSAHGYRPGNLFGKMRTPIAQLQITILACVACIIVFHQVQHLLGCAIAGKMQKKVSKKMFHQASSGHLPCAVG